MVLDSKQMEWASRHGLETATLKKAKVPIFGKWYFPDLPANVPLVNLSTGEVERFPAGFRAGAVLYAKEEDLKRAGIGPYKAAAAPAAAPAATAVAEPVAAAAVAAPAAPASKPATPKQAAAAAAPAAPAPSLHQPVAPSKAAHGGGHSTPSHGAAHGAHDAAHPGPKQYVIIALILCVITAVEVWVYYIPALLAYIFPILIVLSIIKFVMVVGYFMHLKFDHISFTWYFAGGIVLAFAIFSGLFMLKVATHGYAPGDGNAHVFPPELAAPATGAPKPAGGH